MSWFERSFGARYLELYQHRDDGEARRALESLFPEHALAGRRVLDLGCGPGRYLEVLFERGAQAVGVDLSPELLRAAQRRLEPLQRSPQLVRADMRSLPFAPSCFDLTLCMFTTFGYFDPRDRHRQLACEIGSVTRSVIILDVPDAEYVRRNLIAESTRALEGLRVEERRWLCEDPLRVCKTTHLIDVERDELVERFEERVHLFQESELTEYFRGAGFRVEDRRGDYDGQAWRAGVTPRLILRLRREAERAN